MLPYLRSEHFVRANGLGTCPLLCTRHLHFTDFPLLDSNFGASPLHSRAHACNRQCCSSVPKDTSIGSVSTMSHSLTSRKLVVLHTLTLTLFSSPGHLIFDTFVALVELHPLVPLVHTKASQNAPDTHCTMSRHLLNIFQRNRHH